MPELEKYMAQYDHEHTNVWNKVMHGIGIPIIIVGIVLAAFDVLEDWARDVRCGVDIAVGWAPD